MRGCSVFTRPSSISGKPVTSATSVTGSPASASSLAVPPVDSSLTPAPCSSRANSTMPVLSETESRACMESSLFGELVFDELAAQRVSVDAQPFRGLALVAVGVLHHHVEQRLLDGADHHLMHRVRLGAAQVLEIGLEAVPDA